MRKAESKDGAHVSVSESPQSALWWAFSNHLSRRDSRMTAEEREDVTWLLVFAQTDVEHLPAKERNSLERRIRKFLGAPFFKSDVPDVDISACQAVLTSRLQTHFSDSGTMPFTPGNGIADFFGVRVSIALAAAGRALKRCARPDCGQIFIAEGRQVYCTRLCSDRVRMATFRGKLEADTERKEKLRKKRNEAYEKKRQAELGPHVKVGRR